MKLTERCCPRQGCTSGDGFGGLGWCRRSDGANATGALGMCRGDAVEGASRVAGGLTRLGRGALGWSVRVEAGSVAIEARTGDGWRCRRDWAWRAQEPEERARGLHSGGVSGVSCVFQR